MSSLLTDKIRKQVRQTVEENFNIPDTPDLIPDNAEDQFIDIIPDSILDGNDDQESTEDGQGNDTANKTIIDTVSAFVDRPENKTYTIVSSLAFEAEVTDVIVEQGAGAGAVNASTGRLKVGDAIQFTASFMTSDARDLFVQINIIRPIDI